MSASDSPTPQSKSSSASTLPRSPALRLLAPVSGPVLDIESVPDPVFAQKVVGPGIAIDPMDQVLLAPCSGKVVQLHRAHHAVTIEGEGGLQILLHIGLDTVKLNGEGFQPQVKIGDRVQAGQPLIRFDADLVAQKAKSLITVMVVTDTKEDRLSILVDPRFQPQVAAGRDPLLAVAGVGADAGEGAGAIAGAAKGASVQAQTSAQGERAESPELAIENLPTGLHARPAALLANMAKGYTASVRIAKNGRTANAKSVVGIMGLEISLGDRVRLLADGPDAKAAVAALFAFLSALKEAPESGAGAAMGTRTSARDQASGLSGGVSTERQRDPNVIYGVGVSPGLAVGRIQRVQSESFHFSERADASPELEDRRLNTALSRAATDLGKLMSEVKNKTDAAIFSAHKELLDDPDILLEAQKLLSQGKSAPFAWNQAVQVNADRLAGLNNELMANRANDLRDVGRRVLRLLVNADGVPDESGGEKHANGAHNNEYKAGTILVAENITPSETVQLDRSKIVGFCTTTGGATSHVAILARSLGLPAIAGIEAKALALESGIEVLLDGERGELRLNPSDLEKSAAERMQKEQTAKREAALKLSHQSAKTADGHSVEVAANIGSVEDARQALAMGADGVGLLRSEFLFLERDTAPSEEEQYRVYQELADVLQERTLIIRTLDVGGDKPLKYLPIESEENPFLGVRGIRVGFLHPEILREQLRAILRVKSKGKLGVMFPMIASIEEFRQAKAVLEEERARLGGKARGPDMPLEVGIMVEVPSVALAADSFAREADFFSVGTNDLTQYTLAMDRGHKGLAQQVDALHPSVLRQIQLAAEAAHRHGKWIGVCGGLASDLKAVSILIGLGIDELSVSIPTIPLVKSSVRATTLKDSKTLAGAAVQAENSAAVRVLVNPSSV